MMKTTRFAPLLALGFVLILAAACSAAPPAAPTAAPASPPAAAATPAAATTPAALPTPTPEPTKSPASTASALLEASPTPAAAEPAANPTLSPVERLLAAFPNPPQAKGQAVLLFGRVLDTSGDPIPGATVEIWQTDAQGIYDHPGDRSTAARDLLFQSYGASATDADGNYVFRTIEPGYYEPRPKHIHVKVKRDGRELLTTQFYFEEDRAGLGGEGVFSQAGGQGELLILKAVADAAAEAAGVRVLSNDLVLGATAGTLAPTPAQTEGPYYPVADVSSFDNDLTIAP